MEKTEDSSILRRARSLEGFTQEGVNSSGEQGTIEWSKDDKGSRM
jgi:hypothetical protein